MGLWQRLLGPKGPELVRVAVAAHQPEAELLLSILREAEIPAMTRRTAGFELPDYLAAGRRDILVPAPYEAEARAALAPTLEAAQAFEAGDESTDE